MTANMKGMMRVTQRVAPLVLSIGDMVGAWSGGSRATVRDEGGVPGASDSARWHGEK